MQLNLARNVCKSASLESVTGLVLSREVRVLWVTRLRCRVNSLRDAVPAILQVSLGKPDDSTSLTRFFCDELDRSLEFVDEQLGPFSCHVRLLECTRDPLPLCEVRAPSFVRQRFECVRELGIGAFHRGGGRGRITGERRDAVDAAFESDEEWGSRGAGRRIVWEDTFHRRVHGHFPMPARVECVMMDRVAPVA